MTDTTRPGPMPPGSSARLTARGWRDRAGPVAFALVGGAVIFVGGTPYFNLTPANDSPVYNAALVAAFWLLTRLWERREQMANYAVAARALFVAEAAMLTLVVGPFNWLVTGDDDSLQQALQDKLAQFLSVVPVVLLLTLADRRPWSCIYLQKGLTKRWLTFGLGSLMVCGTGVSFVALAGGASATDLAWVAPGVIAFAALNALMEELWFRGILLRPFEVGMGRRGRCGGHRAHLRSSTCGRHVRLARRAIAVRSDSGRLRSDSGVGHTMGQRPVGSGAVPHGRRPDRRGRVHVAQVHKSKQVTAPVTKPGAHQVAIPDLCIVPNRCFANGGVSVLAE